MNTMSFLKTILNSLLGKLLITISLGQPLESYFVPLVVPFFIEFSCSLKFCIAVFTFKESHLLQSLLTGLFNIS